jgi:hypothetical protein
MITSPNHRITPMLFGPDDIICSYTRADMLEDGGLVDVSEIAREAGFKIPVAISRAAWVDCVEWTDADEERTGAYQDQSGRLWDVVFMSFYAAKTMGGSGDTVTVTLARVDREGSTQEAQEVHLKMICHGGDNREPVITIMLPNED